MLQAQRAKEPQPDLSGTWSFSTLTALERPAEFAGKELLTEAEAAAFAKRTMERNNRDNRDTSNRDADVGGAYNEFWWDRGTTVARVGGKFRTSLIVDPPDGRVPALTAPAQERAAARAAERRAHPADGPEDRSLGERCLMFNAGPPMLPGPYNNFMQIIQTRDHVVIYNEMIHDARVDSARRPAARCRDGAFLARRLARAVGRPDAGRRHHEFHRQDERPRIGSEPAPDRAVHPY